MGSSFEKYENKRVTLITKGIARFVDTASALDWPMPYSWKQLVFSQHKFCHEDARLFIFNFFSFLLKPLPINWSEGEEIDISVHDSSIDWLRWKILF